MFLEESIFMRNCKPLVSGLLVSHQTIVSSHVAGRQSSGNVQALHMRLKAFSALFSRQTLNKV